MLRKNQSSRENGIGSSQDALGGRVSSSHHSAGPADKTIIGEHITIEGDIQGREDLIIQGSVKGSIALQGNHLTVGPKGQVEAEINADNVTISGRLTGNIKAKGKVEITKEADFTGEIKARQISVQDGAYLKAVIELEREPERKGATVQSLGAAGNRMEDKASDALAQDQLAVAGDSHKAK